MVKEVKFSCDVSRYEPPVCRDSVLDEESPAEKPRPSAKRRPKGEAAEVAKGAPPARPATERRHLAGADWLADYAPRLRKTK
jgi:hypothetical protein